MLAGIYAAATQGVGAPKARALLQACTAAAPATRSRRVCVAPKSARSRGPRWADSAQDICINTAHLWCHRPYLRHVTSYHPIMRGREKPAQKAVPTWPTSMANMLAQRLSSMGTRWGLWDQAASQLTVRSALKLHRYVSHQPQRQRTSNITHRSPAGGACAVGMVLGGLAAQSEAHWSAEKCRVPSTGRVESGWAAVCAVRCSTAHTHEVVKRRGL